MRIRFAATCVLLAILLFYSTALINAGATGKIVGRLLDAKTGDPIVGASVMVVGTKRGAVTDFEGRFVIGQIEPGTYTIRITHLDYSPLTVTDVLIKPDLSTDVSHQLTKRVTDLGVQIVVKDSRDILNIREVSNEITITKEGIHTQPVNTVNDLLNQVTGVVTSQNGEVFIRGGRAFEVAYLADGVPLGDPVAGLGQAGANLALVPGSESGQCRTKRCVVRPECMGILVGTGPAHGGNAIVNGEAFDAMFFKNYGVNPFVDTEDDHLSTFAIDVDDASYIMMRSYLDRGALPPDEAIRTEEFVNHFKYNYPVTDEETFRVFFEGSPSKFGQNCQMLRIGIKGLEIAPENRKAANLVFVVDVSGSMGWGNRLAMVRQALRLLVDELTVNDRVGIVVYGSCGRVVLEPTSIKDKDKIISAIEKLYPEGATNAEEGIRLGYEMADGQFEKGKINRIILCSDGVANVGRTSPDDILKMIKQYADKGITLSSIGFGMGNYNDILLEKLGNKGNGHYAYVDNIGEAKRVFVDNLTGNLQVIARDVKIQVDFNPEVVRSYRLLGYENRDVDDDKFRDDKEDGGEIGSGHEVTALYEIKFKDEPLTDRVGTIFVRYKDPDDMRKVTEINRDIQRQAFRASFAECSPEYRLAACAAEFSEILRKSYWAKGSKLDDVLNVAKDLVYENGSQELIELMGLISKAQNLEEQLAQK